MPPKAKFTKEDIINASIEIVKDEGFESLTARSLALKLHSSPRPIFTIFNSMEEVIEETRKGIIKLYKNYVKQGLKAKIPFKGTGEAYIRFAIDEPKLFQILFMRETKLNLDANNVLQTIDEDYDAEISLLKHDYSLNDSQAQEMYLHLWIFTHGIATLCATGVCSFTTEQISKQLSDCFKGEYRNIKGN